MLTGSPISTCCCGCVTAPELLPGAATDGENDGTELLRRFDAAGLLMRWERPYEAVCVRDCTVEFDSAATIWSSQPQRASRAARSFKPSLCLLGVVVVDELPLLGEEQPAASVGAAGDWATAGGLCPSASLALGMLASSQTL